MSAKKRRCSKPEMDQYEKAIEKMIAEYVADTGDKDWTRLKVAEWAIQHNKWEQRRGSAVRELSRTIGRVARKVTFTDGDGNKVRKYHAWQLGHDQPTFWSAMDTITLENMNQSLNARRDKLVNGMVKIVVDGEYFDGHHNPGESIRIETDLTRDVKEKRQPSLYDDVPPDEPDAN